jgi:hypothetical protein
MKSFTASAKNIAFLAATFASASSHAASYNIETVEITQLFSATFEGFAFRAVSDDGTFFGDVPNIDNPTFGVNRVLDVSVTDASTAGGVINFDGNQLNNLTLSLPDTTLTILTSNDGVLTTLAQGASITITDIPVFDGGLDDNFDVGSALGSQGEVSQADAAYNLDFSTFNNLPAGDPGVVVSCVNEDGFCGLLPSLALDALRYTIEGTPTANGGDTFILRAQSWNNSYYEIVFTTAEIDGGSKNVPAMGTFGLIALFGGLVAVSAKLRRRVA